MRRQAWERLRTEWREDLPMIIEGLDPMDLPDSDPGRRRYRDEWALTGYGPPEDLPPTPPVVTMNAVLAMVCAVSKISTAIMRSDRRAQYFARRRFMLIYLIGRLCPQRTTHQIARFLNRDHTSILHGRSKMPGLLKHDPELNYEYETCCRHFGIEP